MKFCSECGHPVEYRIPPGDQLQRHVCARCGIVHYLNPRIIVGCVAETSDGRVLMCRRAIEPRIGFWTFPTGFLELGETGAQGAARETLEESLVEVEMPVLFAVFCVPSAGQISMLYRGRMKVEAHGRTAESSQTQLLRESEIPWEEIAFVTIRRGLQLFFEDRATGETQVHGLEISPPFW